MANPNIVGVTSILGKISGQAIGTSAAAIVTNASDSNKIFKINSLIVANIDGSAAADITAYIRKNNATNFFIASTISVLADSTITLIDKSTSIYLEENDSLWLQASAAGDLTAICSFEEIA
jgi:hypothetical protein